MESTGRTRASPTLAATCPTRGQGRGRPRRDPALNACREYCWGLAPLRGKYERQAEGRRDYDGHPVPAAGARRRGADCLALDDVVNRASCGGLWGYSI